MIATFALILAAPMVQTLPPPTADVQSATQFTCNFLVANGDRFALRGSVPEVPAGWDVNRGISMKMEGNGPTGTVGMMDVRPFSSGNEYRRFYFVAPIPGGDHYNIMLALFAEYTGIATIDRFTPRSAGSESKMTSFATGDCEAQFAADDTKKAAK